jgi:indole-3-glycerol phosphate synthase
LWGHALKNRGWPARRLLKSKAVLPRVLCEDFIPVDIAQTYAEHGAACLSVLTDVLQGSIDFPSKARARQLPVLRQRLHRGRLPGV